ncbi:MAG: hypothetical protein KAX69_01520 [Chitinophagales bacterium]|nr:hypothetical protein [Chitinophagales bacterium]
MKIYQIKYILLIFLFIDMQYGISKERKKKTDIANIDTLYSVKYIDINDFEFIEKCKKKLDYIDDSIIYKKPFPLLIVDGISINNFGRDTTTGYFKEREFNGYYKDELDPFLISQIYYKETLYPHDKSLVFINTRVHVYGYEILYEDINPYNSDSGYLQLKAEKVNSIIEKYVKQKPYPLISFNGIPINNISSTDTTTVWDTHCGCYVNPVERFYSDFYPEYTLNIILVKNYRNTNRNYLMFDVGFINNTYKKQIKKTFSN